MERNFTEALALLLSREDYRKKFAEDRTSLARELELGEEHWETFLSLIPAEVERQARILIQKHRYEARRRLLG